LAGTVIKHIWEALSACFRANSEPLTKAQVLAWIGTHYRDADFNSGTLQAQLYRSCWNIPSVQIYGAPKILFYDKRSKTYVRRDGSLASGEAPDTNKVVEEASEQANSRFALEAHLQAYLAKNLSSLEKGLELWSDSPPSVEYCIENRRIDVLAKDAQGVPVVIEMKLDKGYDKVVGQALLYQALISSRLKQPRVRIILVAYEISYELKMACSKLVDVDLFQYAITMKIEKVSSLISEEEVQDGSIG
jgi:hypothetical protein